MPAGPKKQRSFMSSTKSFLTVAGGILLTGSLVWNFSITPAFARGEAVFTRDPAPAGGALTPQYLARRLGVAQRASTMPGVSVKDHAGHKVGKLQDVVLDLNSGHVFCALVTANKGGSIAAVPGKSFFATSAREAVLDAREVNLPGAPLVGGPDLPALVNSLKNSYDYFNQKVFWGGAVAPAGLWKSSELLGMSVRNPANESLGQVVDVMIDLPTARVTFVVVSFAGGESDLYVVPPGAFQSTGGRSSLVLNADRTKVAALAHSDGFFWVNMSDANWALAAYRNFGQNADFDPAGAGFDRDQTRENVRGKVDAAVGTPPVQPKAPATTFK
jgi:sporulation protein YlmC with PRC-barrel domain